MHIGEEIQRHALPVELAAARVRTSFRQRKVEEDVTPRDRRQADVGAQRAVVIDHVTLAARIAFLAHQFIEPGLFFRRGRLDQIGITRQQELQSLLEIVDRLDLHPTDLGHALTIVGLPVKTISAPGVQ